MSQAANYQGFVQTAQAPEMRLPDMTPLTMTRNFTWVFAICVISLLTVPLVVGWTASMLLK